MKLCVSTACQGHGRCYTLAPQLLSSDDEGDPIDVPDDLRELAEEVEGTCPESAISLIDG